MVDQQTGEAKVLAQDPSYGNLDGLTWTPWGTLLFAEERVGGRLFEITLDPKDPTVAVRVDVRPELGIMRHEGIGVASDGSVHVIDEFNGGAIYRFVPTKRGDLSDGRLYALKLNDLTDAQQVWDPATYSAKVGAFTWVAPFVGDSGWFSEEFELPGDLGARLPRGVPVHLFHGLQDEIAPPSHADLYAGVIPHAQVHLLPGRDRQLDNDLSEVVDAISSISSHSPRRTMRTEASRTPSRR